MIGYDGMPQTPPRLTQDRDVAPILETLHYHEQTKHYYHRYAVSLGYLDWDTQPNPFRFYEGVTATRLPLLQRDPPGGHRALYERSLKPFRAFDRESVGAFLELSLGLSAWKSVPGSSWALRMNPSSGNLHPTEAHLILPALPGITAGVFHYSPYWHALEPRTEWPEALWPQVREHFQTDGFLIALTSIFWRESWKYGERAFRYCQHDMGHALAALSFSASLLGWQITWLNGVCDTEVAKMLGLDQIAWLRDEAEEPEALCFVHQAERPIPRDLPAGIVAEFSRLKFQGIPNRLSEDHEEWKIISRVAAATARPSSVKRAATAPGGHAQAQPAHSFYVPAAESTIPAAQIIRQRRSAVSFDGITGLTRNQFCTMLDKTLPRAGVAPFDLGLGDPCVHLLLFVHRVAGLEPGLYFLLRAQRDLPALRQKCHGRFLWRLMDEILPLYLLEAGDFQSTASSVSCGQAIAAESAFSLGMIARFHSEIETAPWSYRQLFWETGMIGQVLYLEAEAQGVRATGIGCFFDDAVHELAGLTGDTFQSLYHFTVGGPREDSRLETRAPYHHLADIQSILPRR